MNLSQRTRYGLRAIFELAARGADEPVTVAEIAAAQRISARFLEQILRQLRQAGYVASRRGVQGGYMLAADPHSLTVGRVIRFFEGPLAPVDSSAVEGSREELAGDHAFRGLWAEVGRALEDVYDSTTFQDLVDAEKAAAANYVANWNI